MNHLSRVAGAARALRSARAEHRQAVREAVQSGERVQDVARFAGLSRQRVYQIVKEEK